MWQIIVVFILLVITLYLAALFAIDNFIARDRSPRLPAAIQAEEWANKVKKELKSFIEGEPVKKY